MKFMMLMLMVLFVVGCQKPGDAPASNESESVPTAQVERPKGTDFRDRAWGVSRQDANVHGTSNARGRIEVVSSEEECSVVSLDCVVIYQFLDGNLVLGTVGIIEEHSNLNDYLGDFDKLANALREKYGAPLVEKTLWKQDLYKNDPQHWGMAVSMGHMGKFAAWETPTTEIHLGLIGDNFDVVLVVEYYSKAHKEAFKAAMRDMQKQGL